MFTTLFRYYLFTSLFRYYFLWRPVGRWVEISAAPFISLWSPIQPQTLPPPATKIATISLFENFYVHDYYLNINDYNLYYSLSVFTHFHEGVLSLHACFFSFFPLQAELSSQQRNQEISVKWAKKGTLQIKLLFFWPQTFFFTFHIV